MTADDLLTLDDTTQSIADWALDYGILPTLIINRLERGWPTAKAIIKPMFVLRGQRLPKPRRARVGVALDFVEDQGTGGGSTAQHFPELEFSK